MDIVVEDGINEAEYHPRYFQMRKKHMKVMISPPKKIYISCVL